MFIVMFVKLLSVCCQQTDKMDNLDEGEKDWKDFEKSLEVCIKKILVSLNNIYPAIFYESPF